MNQFLIINACPRVHTQAHTHTHTLWVGFSGEPRLTCHPNTPLTLRQPDPNPALPPALSPSGFLPFAAPHSGLITSIPKGTDQAYPTSVLGLQST